MHNSQQRFVEWRYVWQRLCCDWRRIKEDVTAGGAEGSVIRVLFPAYVCVFLFRVSNYFYCNGRRRMARCFWLLNFLLTGVDILPSSSIGGGLYIPHPAGVSIFCDAGENLTVMVQCGIGPIYRGYDCYQAPPVLGDNVSLQHHSGVYGAVTVGSNVIISSGCIVLENVASNSCLVTRSFRMKRFSPESSV